MMTVNAAAHPVYKQFHRPGDEKRMIIILRPSQYGHWLACPVAEAARFFTQWTGPLETFAAPLSPRVPKASSVRIDDTSLF